MKGNLISRAALMEVIENIDWHSTNSDGVLHTGAADEESAYIRYADVARAVEAAMVVEAEPVVRCEECRSRVHDVSADEYWCLNPGGLSCRLKDDYFCPFGSRR